MSAKIKKSLFAFPFKKSRKQQGSLAYALFKWFVPGFLAGTSLFLCSWMLHIATYGYVQMMLKTTHDVPDIPDRYSHIPDPGAGIFPKKDIDISILDSIAALFPALFMLGVVLTDDLRTYTKILLCHAFLAILKGMLGAMTTIPDSSGWASCQKRLGPAGVNFFSTQLSYTELLWAEAFGVNGAHFRWCSDMMYSGHTYFTCLYALGLYEVIRTATAEPMDRPVVRTLLISLVCILTAVEQAVEIWAVLTDRFHYSMDIFMAIVITLLFYTNGAIVSAAKYWVFYGRHRRDFYCDHHEDESQEGLVHKVAAPLYSGGDVLVPICCFPFCFCRLAGREHIYNDDQIMDIVEMAVGINNQGACEGDKKEVVKSIREHLRGSYICLDEGIHKNDHGCGWNYFVDNLALTDYQPPPPHIDKKMRSQIARRDKFVQSSMFKGAQPGYVFKRDQEGLGYHLDSSPGQCRMDQPLLHGQATDARTSHTMPIQGATQGHTRVPYMDSRYRGR